MKKYVIFGAAVLFLLAAAAAFGQQGWNSCRGAGRGAAYGAMYDPAKAETLSGEVVSLEKIGRMGRGVGFLLNTGKETLTIHLGPEWYIEQQNPKISAGDSVEVKGVRTVRWGKDVFVAAEIKKGGEILRLRDENGFPVWAGWRFPSGARQL